MAAQTNQSTRSAEKKPRSKSGTTTKGKGRATTQRKKEDKTQAAPSGGMSRTLWTVAFLILSAMSFLCWVSAEKSGVVIDWIRRLERGLVGAGWWTFGPVFLGASILLLLHREKPFRLRLFCTLTMPWLWGFLNHAMMGSSELQLSFNGIAQVYHQGNWGHSGGLLAGFLASFLINGCGRLGAVFFALLLFIISVMILTETSLADIADYIEDILDDWKENGELRPLLRLPFVGDYDAEPGDEPSDMNDFQKEEEPEPMDSGDLVEKSLTQSISRKIKERQKKKALDIPLDDDTPVGDLLEPVQREDEPAVAEAGEEPQPFKKGKKKLFQKKPGKTPPTPVEEQAEPPAEEPAPLMKKEKFVADAQIQHDLVSAASAEVEYYQPPSIELLRRVEGISGVEAGLEMNGTRDLLMETIQCFGINGRIVDMTRGPSVTRYEFELERGVKLSKITNLSRDIALSLGAVSVRIAPVTGKNSVVGIEVPNRLVSPVPIRAVLDSKEFRQSKSPVSFAVGKDISNRNIIGDISRMPHLLIAGTTGSGKSVCTNSMIISLLYKSSPKDVRLIMVDPKMVELSNYNGIPHLLIPVVTDPKKAAGALQWAVFEMLQRYQDFANRGVREIESYNAIMRANPELGEPKPKIVVFIDELADLMIAAAKEVEESICRVAQMGRAAGIHLVIATQRPSSDVITGLMKANIPSRIALAVASAVDSRIILDTSGAEDLVGNGDMLFAPLGKPKTRVQGCFISDEEVNSVIEQIKSNCGPAEYSEEVMHQVDENARKNEKGNKGGASAFNVSTPENYGNTDPEDDRDPLFYDAVDIVVELQMASASTLQRKLKVGYARAARLIDQMEEYGYVGPFEGSKPRAVKVTKEKWKEKKMQLGNEAGMDANLELARMMNEPASADSEPPFDL